MTLPGTDVIIPCWNEESTVGKIVAAFSLHGSVRRIFVVIDRESRDHSNVIIATMAINYGQGRITRVESDVHGKGQCVRTALDLVQTERVVFCDADLTGFTVEHANRLIAGTGLTIGVPDFPGSIPYPLKEYQVHAAWPWVSGQRSVPYDIVKNLELHGYLMEYQINQACHTAGIPPSLVSLKGVKAPLRMSTRRLSDMESDRKWGIANGVLKS